MPISKTSKIQTYQYSQTSYRRAISFCRPLSCSFSQWSHQASKDQLPPSSHRILWENQRRPKDMNPGIPIKAPGKWSRDPCNARKLIALFGVRCLWAESWGRIYTSRCRLRSPQDTVAWGRVRSKFCGHLLTRNWLRGSFKWSFDWAHRQRLFFWRIRRPQDRRCRRSVYLEGRIKHTWRNTNAVILISLVCLGSIQQLKHSTYWLLN